ncbi:MAG TPA: universal stress protein UspA-like protein [Cyanobacteria bacterium UBA11162]|nr:universal stress protein UspA-like protein [Cyanobacteria bacterium UBA11162]
MFHSCLICTDFSDGLHRFVEFVPSLAAGGIKKIVVLHSVPLWDEGEIPRVDEERIAQTRDRLQTQLKSVPDGVDVHIEVPSGRAIDHIPKIAQQYNVDVILTGMQSRSLLQEKLFGSTTAELAKVCTKPLFILRPQVISTYTREELDLRCQHLCRYLLIPYNGSHASDHVLQKVKASIQQAPDHSIKQCMILWVVEDVGRTPILKDQQIQVAQKKLEQIKIELAPLGLEVNTEVRQGNPYLEILDAATVFDISAIAISSDRIGKIIDWPVRSFAGELMRRCWHPILFFPPHS